MDKLELVTTLAALYGPSGREGQVRETLETLCAPYGACTTDPMGNLLVHVQGSGKKLLLAAHMDTVGFLVSRIDKEGMLHAVPVGWLDPAAVAQMPVRFENGVRAVVCMNDDKVGKKLKLDDLYLDVGAPDRAAAERQVQVGDTAVFDAPTWTAGGRIVSPFLDNRCGCAALLLALSRLKAPKNDVYLAFTVQEEVGTRGAFPAAFAVDADYGVAVDTTASDDVPGAVHDGTAVLGEGAAIKILDSSVLCSPELIALLHQIAAERKIPVQQDILNHGGTDAGSMARTRGGLRVGGVSIPCRYAHAPQEMIACSDLDAAADLLAALMETELP